MKLSKRPQHRDRDRKGIAFNPSGPQLPDERVAHDPLSVSKQGSPVGCYDRCNACAACEHVFTDGVHSRGDDDRRDAGAQRESTLTNVRDAFGDGEFCNAGASAEGPFANVRDAFGDGEGCNAGASMEGKITNVCDAFGDGECCNAGASIERKITDTCHSVRKHDYFGQRDMFEGFVDHFAVPVNVAHILKFAERPFARDWS